MQLTFHNDPARIEMRWHEKNPGVTIPAHIIEGMDTVLQTLEQRWRDNEHIVLSLLETVAGVSTDRALDIFVLPPQLDMGQYLDGATFEFGHDELYKNYSVIGIAHEILHCLTHDFYATLSDDDKWIFHALVYLSTDEELRFVLNGKSDYFSSPIIKEYHARLIGTARDILPLWLEHMKDPQKESLYELFERLKGSSIYRR